MCAIFCIYDFHPFNAPTYLNVCNIMAYYKHGLVYYNNSSAMAPLLRYELFVVIYHVFSTLIAISIHGLY